MNISRTLAFTALAAAAFLGSCKNKSPYEGYDATDNGLYYKFYNEHSDDGKKPVVGESIVISYKIKTTDKDSMLLDSKDVSRDHSGNVEFPLVASTFKGSFEEGIMMMSPGDSASFIVSADSFLLKTNKLEKLPPFIKPGSMLTIDTKLVSIKDSVTVKKEREQAMKDQQKQMEEYQKQVEERKNQEGADIQAYLKNNKINAKPTQSGLYYIEKRRGTGTRVQMGDSAKVNYSLTLLDGTSLENGTAMFSMDVQGMIAGFVEGITMMNVGGKATLVLPSSIAYGPQGSQSIPPYTPLVFEVEVLDVKKK
jgi:FKBP-type peptidyl-prolyl cis-trans isomerase FkpA